MGNPKVEGRYRRAEMGNPKVEGRYRRVEMGNLKAEACSRYKRHSCRLQRRQPLVCFLPSSKLQPHISNFNQDIPVACKGVSLWFFIT